MITFENIQKANESIRTTDIKGKDYAEVNQRIKAFRQVYPTGRIATTMLSNEGGICVFFASVGYWEDNGEFRELGTGTAQENEKSSFINKTSYIENCETSAVGRALGMCGFGIDTSIASAEEVQNAINNLGNEQNAKATPKQVEILKKVYVGENLEKLLSANNINSIEEISLAKASEIISALKKSKENKNG